MKLVVGLLLIMSLASCYSFDDYVSQFSKVYSSDQERAAREAVFNSKMEYYSQFNSEGHGYTIGPTKWTDIFENETAKILNGKFEAQPTTTTNQAATSQGRVAAAGTIPDVLDWRSLGKVSSIKDQGQCGCCWAFTTAATTESYLLIKNVTMTDVSEEYILQCTGSNSTCDGGYVNAAMNLVKSTGVPLESTYPYLGGSYTGTTTPYTAGICTKKDSFLQLYSNTTVTIGFNVNDTKMISYLQDSPVSVAFAADTNFMAYNGGGIFRCNYTVTNQDLNHAVQVVGYNQSGNYYIIKNSWGTTWGMNGFAYVDMTQDCGIKTQVYRMLWGEGLKYFTALLLVVAMTI